jgi:hypothetical protein
MEFPPFSATTTGEKASQTDGFQSTRRINRYPLRSRDKDGPPRLRVSRSKSTGSIIACLAPAFTFFVEFDAIMLTWDRKGDEKQPDLPPAGEAPNEGIGRRPSDRLIGRAPTIFGGRGAGQISRMAP